MDEASEEDIASEAVGFEEPGSEVDRLAFRVIGAAVAVHRALGPGHPEECYHRAMCIELGLRGISFVSEYRYDLIYKGQKVGQGRVDLMVEDKLIVELKCCDELSGVHVAQVIAYLKATGRQLGLLLNFKVALMKNGVRRIANTR